MNNDIFYFAFHTYSYYPKSGSDQHVMISVSRHCDQYGNTCNCIECGYPPLSIFIRNGDRRRSQNINLLIARHITERNVLHGGIMQPVIINTYTSDIFNLLLDDIQNDIKSFKESSIFTDI